jgi:hypothetical protein
MKFQNTAAVGKKTRCPKCQTVFVIEPPAEPEESPLFEVIDEEPAPALPPQEFAPMPARVGHPGSPRGRKKAGSRAASSETNLSFVLISGGVLGLAAVVILGAVFMYFLWSKPKRQRSPVSFPDFAAANPVPNNPPPGAPSNPPPAQPSTPPPNQPAPVVPDPNLPRKPEISSKRPEPWLPEADAMEALDEELTLYEKPLFRMRPPKGHIQQKLPHGHAWIWRGMRRADGTAAQLIVTIMPAPSLPFGELDSSFLPEFFDNLKGLAESSGQSFENFQQLPLEWGFVCGVRFLRTRWSAFDTQSGNKVYGFAYVGLEKRMLLEVIGQEIEPYHESTLKAFEAAALTLRGEDALPATPAGTAQGPSSAPPTAGGSWAPDDSLFGSLAAELKVTDKPLLYLRPPKGISEQRLSLLGNEAVIWVGERRRDGSGPTLILSVASLPGGTTAEQVNIDEFIGGWERGFVASSGLQDIQKSAPESGEIRGVKFMRLRWNALVPQANKRMHGFAYFNLEGTTVVQLVGQDLEPHHQSTLKLYETSALTVRWDARP